MTDNSQFQQIHGATLELGRTDFSVYRQEKSEPVPVPFIEAGTEIKFALREQLIKLDNLYIRDQDRPAYNRYIFNRIERLVRNQFVPDQQKANLFFEVGRVLVDSIQENPLEIQNIQNFGRFIKSYIDLMLHSEKSTAYLLEFAASSRYSLSHAFNVATFCMLIGRKLFGNNRLKLWQLGIGGMLCDIGMTRISVDLINKSSKLTDSEKLIVQQHTFIGRRIIERLDFDKIISDMVYSHHERFDGSGYPKGLKGKDIPTFARIAAVADVYDAITSDRSYRKGKNYIDALSEIYKMKNAFDPKVVDALLRIVLKSEKLVQNFKERHSSE